MATPVQDDDQPAQAITTRAAAPRSLHHQRIVAASDGELGLAMVGIGAGALPAMILTGRLWRRLGWWLLPVTAVAFGVAALGPIVAHTPAMLAIVLVLVGASSGAPAQESRSSHRLSSPAPAGSPTSARAAPRSHR